MRKLEDFVVEHRIGIDANGGTPEGDLPARVRIVRATQEAAKKHLSRAFVLYGDEKKILADLRQGEDHDNIFVRASGLKRLVSNVNDRIITGFYTIGNTGRVGPAIMRIGFIDEFARVFPDAKSSPLLAEIPKSPYARSDISTWYLLDAGGIPRLTTPEQYALYARLGAIYACDVGGRENPTVGLLNIGEEASKGNSLDRAAYNTLANDPRINFIGNVEPHVCAYDVEKGKDETRRVDVVVAAGDRGNLVLKTLPVGAALGNDFLKHEVQSGGLLGRIAGAYIKAYAGARAKQKGDPNNYGGVPFIGLKAPVFKSHGATTKEGIMVGLDKLIAHIDKKVTEQFKDAFRHVYAA